MSDAQTEVRAIAASLYDTAALAEMQDGPQAAYDVIATALSARDAAKDAELAAVKAERDNLRAGMAARAKTLLKLRDVLVRVHDHIEDEGDRVYFGSTNDADILKEVWHELDGWVWDDIMAEGKLPDVYEASRKAHARAERAEAQLAEANKARRAREAQGGEDV